MLTERIATGISGLDPLIEGGFPKGRSILITGEPGTGKSIFALQFLCEGLKRKEKCILVSADEEPVDLIEQAGSMGWDLEAHIENKELAILNAEPYLSSVPAGGSHYAIDVTKAVSHLARFVDQIGATRLALDPGGPFLLAREGGMRSQDQTRMLIKSLRTSLPTTNVLTSYAVPRTGERTMHGIEEYLVAGAIVLEMIWQDGKLARSLIVEKMRGTGVKPAQLEFDIVKGQGIMLSAPTGSR